MFAEFVSRISLTRKAILKGTITSLHTHKTHRMSYCGISHPKQTRKHREYTQNLTMNLNNWQFYRNTITVIMNRSIKIF